MISVRIILKLIATPFALALTIASAVVSFVLSLSDVLFGIVSSIVFLASVVLLLTGQTTGGFAWMAVAFLISPFGLPAAAGWLGRVLGGVGDLLKSFIFS